MSEDRTQAPSKLRRQQARERGQVAHSPELTGAVGLLAAVALLGAWGDELAAGLLALVREPLTGPPVVAADLAEVVARLRHLALGILRPLGLVLAGFAAAALAAHQAQVQGLWAPGLLAPDPTRLWTLGHGPGLASRAGRGAWSVVKAVVVVAVAAWAIRSGWSGFQALGHLEPPALAHAAGRAMRDAAGLLAVATLALGLIDFAMQYQRFETLLRTTPEEHREDQRSMEGDPAVRARRRRLARSWRADSPEVLAGASLVLTGPSGLTIVLAGGPPPRRVSIRSALQGPQGLRLRSGAESARIPRVDAPDLARRLASLRTPALPVPAELHGPLARAWTQAQSQDDGERPR
jgi:flagellar biosynthetic protein FlhB